MQGMVEPIFRAAIGAGFDAHLFETGYPEADITRKDQAALRQWRLWLAFRVRSVVLPCVRPVRADDRGPSNRRTGGFDEG